MLGVSPSPLGAVIRRRRMTRRFTAEPLPDGLLASLVDLARRAPTAGYSQGVHFVVLEGSSLVAFWEVTGAGEWFASASPGVLAAPAIVVPVGVSATYTSRYSEADKAGHGLEDPTNWPVPYWLTDTAMAAENLLLLVEEARLGALLFGIFRNERAWLDSIGAPSTAQAVGAIAIGHRAADDAPSGSAATRPRASATSVIHLGHW